MSNLKKGFIYFFLSSLFLVSIFNFELAQTYKFELFENKLNLVELLSFFGHSSITFTTWVIPISIMVFALVLYQKQVKLKSFRLKTAMKQSFIPLILFCLFSFLWSAFIVPKANLHLLGYLYDIRMKTPEEPLKRSDVNKFKGNSITSDFFDLLKLSDTASVTKPIINSKSEIVLENKIELSRMISFPFIIFISFYIGLFISIFNRHKNNILFPLIGIHIFIAPIYYYTIVWFEKLQKHQTLTPFQGQFLLILSVFTISTFLYFYLKKKLNLEQQSCS